MFVLFTDDNNRRAVHVRHHHFVHTRIVQLKRLFIFRYHTKTRFGFAIRHTLEEIVEMNTRMGSQIWLACHVIFECVFFFSVANTNYRVDDSAVLH